MFVTIVWKNGKINSSIEIVRNPGVSQGLTVLHLSQWYGADCLVDAVVARGGLMDQPNSAQIQYAPVLNIITPFM